MRIAIREQLAFLVLTAVLVALAVVSVPTWLYVNDHIAHNLRDGLALTASLKASSITSQLELIQTSCWTISSRLLIQRALEDFYTNGTNNWDGASVDLTTALGVGTTTGLLQARIYPRNDTGIDHGLLNVTAANISEIVLPYHAPDGSPVTLSDTEYGYPPSLYPNITYVSLGRENEFRPETPAIAAEPFPGVRISRDGGLLLGPLVLNETTALLSVSVPIRDNRDHFILGYMTVVALASSIIQIKDSREGLDKSGVVLIVGPTNSWNRFDQSLPPSNATFTPNKDEFAEVDLEFILPPVNLNGTKDRHSDHLFSDSSGNPPFPAKAFPAALEAFTQQNDNVNNASAKLRTHNEQGVGVAVGFARTQTPLVNWTVIVEKSFGEAYEPIETLRNILLGTVFGTAGFLALIIFPCAHFSVMPIRKLKSATEKSINPPGYDDSFSDSDYEVESPGSGSGRSASGRMSHRSKKGIITTISRLIKGRPIRPAADRDPARRLFKIPGKVHENRHVVTDELTELTRTFNDMSDELVKQYTSLDDKVAERTKELMESKKSAEAANESKTLFIANISHELKTPLNGILGLCAVSMEENDMSKIRQSLKVVYESGDLLLHLLEDLLSFSKNQIGHQIVMEPKEFRLTDIRSQILSIFDNQVRDRTIDFSVNFINTPDIPDSASWTSQLEKESTSASANKMMNGLNLEDIYLWGDQHRILQVIINLVSNSLKFTPANGKVEVRIKCLGADVSAKDDLSRSSSLSQSRNSRTGRVRQRGGSSSVQSTNSGIAGASGAQKGRTALVINPMDPKTTPQVQIAESSASTPRPNGQSYVFEFQVQDTGPGIAENLQDKVFEPFVQGDPGLSKKFGGTGLGLSICQQLAVLMGGSITLDSTVGVGTTFTMHIPLKFAGTRIETASINKSVEVNDEEPISTVPPDPTKAGTEATQPANALNSQPRLVGLSQPYFSTPISKENVNGETKAAVKIPPLVRRDTQSKLRVLVADDNSTNIEVVKRMLKLEDVSDVTIAKDGQEAYDLVKGTMENNQPFDVIFMDVQMPNVDGLQSTRLIRQAGFTSPIVALTAFSEESNVKDCMNSGMNEFLAKPIRRPALKQVLQRFATIPEEPETASTMTKPSSDPINPSKDRRDSVMNGNATKSPNSTIPPAADTAAPPDTVKGGPQVVKAG
jgi:osomolarity two-component system sensor histidine kinase SLN1